MTIHLHGPQAHLLSEPYRCVADTIEEAMNALGKMVPALWPVPGQARPVYEIVGVTTPDQLFQPTEMREIHLVPMLSGGGGKGGGFLQIALGVALIALAWWNPAGLLGAATIFGMSFSLTGMVLSFGVSLLLGGLLSLIATPTPDTMGMSGFDTNVSQGGADPASSRYLGSNKNTTKLGTRVSIAFGRNKIPGQYISFNIDSTEGLDTAYNPVAVTNDPDIAPGSAHFAPTAVYP